VGRGISTVRYWYSLLLRCTDLRSVDSTQRVGREVTEVPVRPVHVLHPRVKAVLRVKEIASLGTTDNPCKDTKYDFAPQLQEHTSHDCNARYRHHHHHSQLQHHHQYQYPSSAITRAKHPLAKTKEYSATVTVFHTTPMQRLTSYRIPGWTSLDRCPQKKGDGMLLTSNWCPLQYLLVHSHVCTGKCCLVRA
jgi:hypothetical protein